MKKERILKNRNKLLVACSILLILFTHFYMIGQVPRWLNVDEAGIAYDAYCLSHYGVDRFCNRFPVFFINYGGGGQSPLFTYILAIFMYFFGYSMTLIRTIIAIASLVTGYFGYKLIKLRFSGLESPVYFLLFSIMPIFIMYFRIGMDCALMLPTGTVFLYFFSRAILSEKKKDYFIAGITGGLVLYSYTLSYIVMPLMLLFSFIYLLWMNTGKRKELWINWIIMAIPLGILASPLLLVQIINMKHLGTKHFGIFTFPQLPWYRSGELALDGFFSQILSAFRYTNICDYLYYNATPKYGNFYYISVPFIVIGFFYAAYQLVISLKEKKIDLIFIPVIWTICEYILAGIMSINTPPHASRLNGILSVLLYFLVLGLFRAYALIRRYSIKASVCFVSIFCAAYGLFFIFFCHYYFGDYSKDIATAQGKTFSAEFNPVLSFLNGNGARYADDMTYIDEDGRYIYYVLADQTNPYEIPLVNAQEAYLYDGYKNFCFSYPEELDYSANYVSELQSPYLTDLGFREIQLEDYFFYVSPISDMEVENISSDSSFYNIEALTGGNTGIMIRGWCLGTDVGIEIDSAFYAAETFSRPDVAQAYGLSEEADYGFICTIPFDIFEKHDTYTLVAHKEDGTKDYLCKIYNASSITEEAQ